CEGESDAWTLWHHGNLDAAWGGRPSRPYAGLHPTSGRGYVGRPARQEKRRPPLQTGEVTHGAHPPRRPSCAARPPGRPESRPMNPPHDLAPARQAREREERMPVSGELRVHVEDGSVCFAREGEKGLVVRVPREVWAGVWARLREQAGSWEWVDS